MEHIINTTIEGQIFPNERDLYNQKNTLIKGCKFAGAADGESALKECRDIVAQNCQFDLRYPLWHAQKFTLQNCNMSETCRAAIWYAKSGEILNCNLGGIKVLRECSDITIDNTNVDSLEFGWKCKNISTKNTKIKSEYAYFGSDDVSLDNVEVQAKYSFQYMNNLNIKNSKFITKDAFWHSNNIVVENTVLEGEYLAWFSKNLTLRNCTIRGTQPFCYCEGLRLINCTMQDCDLAFEYADVEADVHGHLVSIKNPKSGKIVCDSVDEIIHEDAIMECSGEVVVR